jgi:hypothetical protein
MKNYQTRLLGQLNKNYSPSQKTIDDLQTIYRVEDVTDEFHTTIVELENGKKIDGGKFYRVLADE